MAGLPKVPIAFVHSAYLAGDDSRWPQSDVVKPETGSLTAAVAFRKVQHRLD